MNVCSGSARTDRQWRSGSVGWASALSYLVSCAACVLLLTPRVALASGFTLSEQSATASGTAAAGAARQDDAGLAWYDPAALADGRGLRMGLGVTLAYAAVTAQANDGSFTTQSETSLTPVPHLDVSFATGHFAAGVALGVPFGSSVSWPPDWPGRRESVSSSLVIARAAPFVAWRFDPIRVAVGVHVDRGRMQLEQKLDFIDEDGDVAIDMDGTGVGFDASLFWQVMEQLDLGLVYRGRTSIDFNGGANFTLPDPLADRAKDQGARTHLTMPDQVVLGARWHQRSWAVLADVEYTAWGVYDRLTVDLADPTMKDVTQAADWGATIAVRAGVEVLATSDLTLRAGAYYDPSAVPDATLSAAVPDTTRIGGTLGVSLAVSKQWSLDAFYEFMWLASRASSSDTLAATYSGTAHFLGLGVRFAQRGK